MSANLHKLLKNSRRQYLMVLLIRCAAIILLCEWALAMTVSIHQPLLMSPQVSSHKECSCGCDVNSTSCCCTPPATGLYLQSCATISIGVSSPQIIQGSINQIVNIPVLSPLQPDCSFIDSNPVLIMPYATEIDHPPQVLLYS